jgi:soluble lytic murein transglycosylase-like protein
MRTAAILLCAVLLASIAVAQAKEDPEARYYADAYARHYGVPVALVHAVIAHESAWHSGAISNKGAAGLMQLMPETARYFGVRNPFDRRENISGGVRYLRLLLDRFHGDFRLVMAAYYAGEANVGRRGLHYSNPDVVAYVEQIRRRYTTELSLHGGQR